MNVFGSFIKARIVVRSCHREAFLPYRSLNASFTLICKNENYVAPLYGATCNIKPTVKVYSCRFRKRRNVV